MRTTVPRDGLDERRQARLLREHASARPVPVTAQRFDLRQRPLCQERSRERDHRAGGQDPLLGLPRSPQHRTTRPSSAQTWAGRTVSGRKASTNMAYDTDRRRDDDESRDLCIACHGTSEQCDLLGSRRSATSTRCTGLRRSLRRPGHEHRFPPTRSAKTTACTDCHKHNGISVSCTDCHGFPPMLTLDDYPAGFRQERPGPQVRRELRRRRRRPPAAQGRARRPRHATSSSARSVTARTRGRRPGTTRARGIDPRRQQRQHHGARHLLGPRDNRTTDYDRHSGSRRRARPGDAAILRVLDHGRRRPALLRRWPATATRRPARRRAELDRRHGRRRRSRTCRGRGDPDLQVVPRRDAGDRRRRRTYAPNVMGNGTTWGAEVNGHGLASRRNTTGTPSGKRRPAATTPPTRTARSATTPPTNSTRGRRPRPRGPER